MGMKTLEDLKAELAKCEEFLKTADKRRKFSKRVENRASQLRDMIFKIEAPELYESYIKAEKAFFENTHIF